LGGAIAPGVQTSLESLFKKTELLPKTKPAAPSGAIGRSTACGLQIGASTGIAGLCDRIIEDIQKSLKHRAQVIATGGGARFISKFSRQISYIDPDLVLKGIYFAFQKKSLDNLR
jgi:type III pantothenate kinase